MNTASLQSIAMSVAQEREPSRVLHRVVAELAREPNIALTRIWLLKPGDRCAMCTLSAHCQTQVPCLHLAASCGTPRADGVDWTRLDGSLARVPLGHGKVGRIGATGESLHLEQTADDRQWIFDRGWIREEGITSFAGHPLLFRGEVLGVLAIFSRDRLTSKDFERLRGFADHAAIAIANARAFEEIERLRRQLESENHYLREEVNEVHAVGQIIGSSAPVAKMLEQIELVAPTNASVLVLGESGTGKELVARAIHERSNRRNHPLVKVNCAAVPRDLFESEFFGHVKGSFTGALRDRLGRFQLANEGTIFLDEIGEIPLELQGKLLRVLQEGQIERVGEEQTRHINVRVIAATNRDLQREVDQGRFRQDLYFRLSVFPIEVLPLRARVEDIPLLSRHFLERCCRQMHRPLMSISNASLNKLMKHHWPGNIRELQNVIERGVISSRSQTLELDESFLPVAQNAVRSSSRHSDEVTRRRQQILTASDIQSIEIENLRAALDKSNGKIYGPRGAAEILGIKPTTLASRLKKLGIRRV